jgi:hypothetical protein
MGLFLLLAWVLRQPMIGVLLIGGVSLTMALSSALGALPWIVLALKLALWAIVSLLVPVLWPEAGGLIPVNPDQKLYLETASRIAEALRVSLLKVDYAGIVGLHNRAYSVVLGWLAFLNGGGSALLYRLFNVFLSLVLAALAYALARSLYPPSRKAAVLVFLGVGLLPSINLYSMFVLRDVMIAAVLMLVVLGLFGQKFWVILVGLALTYFTRIQLFFLLVGAIVLFAAMRGAQRARRWAHELSLALLAGFVIAGYFFAPLVLPPEYDYSHAMSILSFGRFLVHLVPSVLGLDFLFADQTALELGRSTLGAARLLLFDTWLVPLLFMGGAIYYRRMAPKFREFYLWVAAVVIGYAAGYWITYGAIFVRLLVPLYPLFLLAAAVGISSVRDGISQGG